MAPFGDDYGDRMKGYEPNLRFKRGVPVYARLDGRGFSKFTRGMKRPFDPRMSRAMIETTKYLVAHTHARIGYTQSDEISLVWLPEKELLFDGKSQKMISVLPAMATATFILELFRNFDGADRWLSLRPHFDARVFQLPDKVEAANVILWRAMDATKNAVQMAAHTKYSPRAMHGVSQHNLLEMLKDAGVDFAAYPAFFRQGTFVRRMAYMKAPDDTIPEPYRPTTDILRHEVREIEMPVFNEVANRVEVIFDGADPICKA